MNLLLALVSPVILYFFINYQRIKVQRKEHKANLVSIYSKMEMFFIKEKIHLNKDYKDFLKIFKNLSVNPGFLDIQVLLAIKISAEKKGILKQDKEWFDKTLNSLGEDFKLLNTEFDEHTDEILRLSVFKPEFIFFVSRKYIINSFKEGIVSPVKFFLKQSSYRYIKNNEQALTFTGMKML